MPIKVRAPKGTELALPALIPLYPIKRHSLTHSLLSPVFHLYFTSVINFLHAHAKNADI